MVPAMIIPILFIILDLYYQYSHILPSSPDLCVDAVDIRVDGSIHHIALFIPAPAYSEYLFHT